MQTHHLDSFLKLGESLQLCELKAKGGTGDLCDENEQHNDLLRNENEQQNGLLVKNENKQQKATDSVWSDKQKHGLVKTSNTDKGVTYPLPLSDQQDVKVSAPKSEIRVTTAIKQEILKNQDRPNIPFAKPMKSISWFKSIEEQALFKCDECESKFQRENLLGIHKSARHGNRPASPPKKPRKRRSDARPLPVRT